MRSLSDLARSQLLDAPSPAVAANVLGFTMLSAARASSAGAKPRDNLFLGVLDEVEPGFIFGLAGDLMAAYVARSRILTKHDPMVMMLLRLSAQSTKGEISVPGFTPTMVDDPVGAAQWSNFLRVGEDGPYVDLIYTDAAAALDAHPYTLKCAGLGTGGAKALFPSALTAFRSHAPHFARLAEPYLGRRWFTRG